MTYSLQIPSIMHKAVFWNMIDTWMSDPSKLLNKNKKTFPITDLYRDKDDNQIIEMAIAGYNKESIKIETESNQIVISSNGVKSERVGNIARRGFQKTFVDYNNELDLSGATASLEHGLLIIKIKPKVTSKSTSIPIK